MVGLYTKKRPFFSMSITEKQEFLRCYRKRRSEDMKKPPTNKKIKIPIINTKLNDLGISEKDLKLAKKLGISKKALLELKEIANENNKNINN